MTDLSMYELEDIIWDDLDREDKREGESCKKPRFEVTSLQSNEGNLNASGSVCQFKEDRESKTLDKETDMMGKDSWSHIPDGVFTDSGDADSAKDVLSVQSGSELYADEGILKDTCGAVDRNSYNDLNLFTNDKGSSDLLYFGWPDIGNLEDVDRMLSNCNSSFGLGITSNDDELVWLTSEDPGGGYEEALKMDLKFPCSEPSTLTNTSQDHEPQESNNKTKRTKEQSRQPYKTEGTKAGHCLESYGLKTNGIQISSSYKSDKPFTPLHNWQQTKNFGHGSVGYMQSNAYVHPGGSNLSIGSSDQRSFTGSHNRSDMMLLASGNDPVPSQKHFQVLGKKIEYQSDMVGVKKGASAESDLLDVPEASSISSELNEISPEATTFRQLQQVIMLQLDMRTRLCIRDSLYRLARSAEQRHNYAVTEGTSKFTGLMDMETDTNPIDRTIAHLLFHRPSDSSNMSIPCLKQNTKVHGSMAGLPMVTEKPSCQQTEHESHDKISSTRKN